MKSLFGGMKRCVRAKQLDRYTRAGLQVGTEPYLISLGDHVQISGNVTFLTHDGATWIFSDRSDFTDVHKFGRITVCDNCFVGHGAIILPGVTIGPNSVVAAGAIVTKDVPEGTVVGGNPARVISRVDHYAARAKENATPVDVEAYESNKQMELTRVLPPPC